MSHGGQVVLAFVIGGVIGMLVGWNLARARYAPVGDDSVPQLRTVRTALSTFLKNAALLAVAAVVILVLATNIVHSRR
jgi:hypothetical protein